MDNLDDSENNAKISDSAYSNSCSNSQSRRSHSSKSTHSGSNCSGSSGYGGKPSTSGSSNKNDQTSKKEKESKKKKQSQTQSEAEPVEEPVVVECRPPEPQLIIAPPILMQEKANDAVEMPATPLALPEKAVENIDIYPMELSLAKDEIPTTTLQACTSNSIETSCQVANIDSDGFSCAISMHDGVVMYTTQSLTTNLGFPKDMWIGRSFIDFVHPKDRNTFASQVTNGLVVPKIASSTDKVTAPGKMECSMVCRIRRYRTLGLSFGIKERNVAYMPFLLKFSIKDFKDDDGNIVYLITQATPFYSAYKTPHECLTDAMPFVIRHSADGLIEYIDIKSVPYLGYMPQDVHKKNALLMYHPDDMPYLKVIYESIVKDGTVSRSKPFRILAQNGDYVKLETEWSSFINPWSMKLEFVIGKHHVIQGPMTPDVFLSPPPQAKTEEEDTTKSQMVEMHLESILRILKDVPKPAEKAKQKMSKRCQDLAMLMESLLEEQPILYEKLRVEIQETDINCCERDSVMLGGLSPHHDNNDSRSGTETPLSYNQLNYKDNLQRYFDSHQNYVFEENKGAAVLEENSLVVREMSNCPSPFEAQSSASTYLGSSSSSVAIAINSLSPPDFHGEFQPPRLTESLLTKHNTDMEKELVKTHRETKTCSKVEQDQDARQKKKEHLARCNATFQPTMAGAATESLRPHGVKRHLKSTDMELANKQHCSQSRSSRRRQNTCATANAGNSSNGTYVATIAPWTEPSTSQMNNLNSYVMGVPQQISIISHQMSGVFPMYYSPTPGQTHSPMPSAPSASSQQAPDVSTQPNQPQHITHTIPGFPGAPMPWMYPQPMYGSPFMYPQMSYNVQQQALMAQTIAYNQSVEQTVNLPLGLATSNYVQGSEARLNENLEHNALQQSTEPVSDSSRGGSSVQLKNATPTGQSLQNSDETMDRTDGDSSYSSFYSSFFKTESGSADDSSDAKKARNELHYKKIGDFGQGFEHPALKKVSRRKMGAPWLEQVTVTPELLFKYQVPQKTMEEILNGDRERMKSLEQPALVNEQLGQLYQDLQLEGVASRLTLEEGISSSSSSGEDTSLINSKFKSARRKRVYSKLNMIYEENAPLPPPSDLEDSSGEGKLPGGDSDFSMDQTSTPMQEESSCSNEQDSCAMDQVSCTTEQVSCAETQAAPTEVSVVA